MTRGGEGGGGEEKGSFISLLSLVFSWPHELYGISLIYLTTREETWPCESLWFHVFHASVLETRKSSLNISHTMNSFIAGC